MELIIVLVIALIIFGPKKLPDLGRSLGTSFWRVSPTGTNARNRLPKQV